MMEQLFFRVDPNILNIIRQAYWFEGRQDWALKCLSCIGEGVMTLEQGRQLLGGDAHFITEDEGITLTMVFEDEPEFKQSIIDFRRGLAEAAERERQARMKMEQDLDDSKTDKVVREFEQFIEDNKNKDPADILMQRLTMQANAEIQKQAFIQKWTTNDPEERKVFEEIERDMRNKVFEFVFKGHHYTFKDSARSQAHCPHCDCQCSNNIWNSIDDKDAFIGKKHLQDNMWAICFRCPKCFENFFYHQTKRMTE